MISGTKLHAQVQKIVSMGERRSGTEVEHRVMEYLRKSFAEIGLREADIEWFDMHRWHPARAVLKILPEQEQIKCKPVWYTGSTPPDGIRAECVYCGYGMPQEFASAAGKVAIMDGRTLLHFLPTYRFFNSYQSALSAGARALVIITDTPGDLIPIFTAEEEEHQNPLPAVLISRSDGALLKNRVMTRKTEIRINVAGESEIARTGDVVAVLPGQTDEYIIIGAHHDSIYAGAVDNAAGLAALLAIASEFAARPTPPRKNIVFATHPAHELLIGAREFIKRRSNILEKTAAYITLDGIGCDNYEEIDGEIVKTGRDEIRGVFISPNPILAGIIFPILMKYKMLPAAFLPADLMCPNEDLEGRFSEAGVPIIDVIGKPLWYHTEQDTPDKCTPDQLERGARAHMNIIEEIDVLPTAEIRAAERRLIDPRSLIQKASPRSRPEIDFSYLPERVSSGEPVLIYVTGFDDREGILVDMNWEIGGEAGSKGPVLLHVFDRPGEYLVRLTVVNNLGAEGKSEKRIKVS